MLSISIQCELVTIPRLWKRLSEETLEVVQDVSVLGIRCAPLVLDVTNTIRSSIDMSDEVEVINELNQDSYRKLLRLSCKDAEMAEQKLIRILKGMKSVPKHYSSGNANH